MQIPLLKHERLQDIANIDGGLVFREMSAASTFNALCYRIAKYGEFYRAYGYEDYTVEDKTIPGSNKFKGDLFEIFAECFFGIFAADNRTGVYNYAPVPAEEDNGVDGTATNMDGLLTTVQVKFKTNPETFLKERDIKQFGFQSVLFGVDPNATKNMVVFTNCKGLHWYTNNIVFRNKLRTIDGLFLSKMVDNNPAFFDEMRKLIHNSLEHYGILPTTDIDAPAQSE